MKFTFSYMFNSEWIYSSQKYDTLIEAAEAAGKWLMVLAENNWACAVSIGVSP